MVVCIVLCLILAVVCRDVVASVFFFQAEDGIRDLVRSRGLGDVYKRQRLARPQKLGDPILHVAGRDRVSAASAPGRVDACLSLIHI